MFFIFEDVQPAKIQKNRYGSLLSSQG